MFRGCLRIALFVTREGRPTKFACKNPIIYHLLVMATVLHACTWLCACTCCLHNTVTGLRTCTCYLTVTYIGLCTCTCCLRLRMVLRTCTCCLRLCMVLYTCTCCLYIIAMVLNILYIGLWYYICACTCCLRGPGK